ncbi:MAG: MFS transporter [Deltaproteobacteria bacterium]|nr:MFS transporter [Deltaproteobacteria bacterium]
MAYNRPMAANPTLPVRRREIFGWAMFDFANSSYTTLIITVAFGVYFTKIVAAGDNADWLWGLGIAITNLIVMVTSPLAGAIADDAGRKKLFLFVTYSTCVVGTAGLFFAVPGQIVLALGLLVLSNVAFSFGENFAGAFLPEISTPANIGRISALGWGVGYFGGLACLILVRPLLQGLDWEPARLLAPENAQVFLELRLAWVVTAGFFLLAGIPTFLFLRERAPRGPKRSIGEYARIGFRRLGETTSSIRHFTELRWFLGTFFLFQAGLTAVVAFAGIFAESTLGFTANELILLFILLQFSAAGGALAFGWIQDRLGGRAAIQITLVLWTAVCIGTYLCHSKSLFWGIAIFSGLAIGSLQAASRALVGLFSPPAKSGEFFGFWGLAGKGAYLVGPLAFGAISSITGSQRTAILAVGLFFILGMVGMHFVDEGEGRRQAESWNTTETGDPVDAGAEPT